METLRLMGLCVTAAMICSALRSSHPQIASAVAVAAGIIAMTMCLPQLKTVSEAAKRLSANTGGEEASFLLRICGIAMVAEFAADICRDSGETALSRRIEVCVRIGLLAGGITALSDVMGRISVLLQ